MGQSETEVLSRAASHLPDAPKKRRGPIPRSVRFASTRMKAERRIAVLLPEIIEALAKAARGGDTKAGIALVSWLIGSPAKAQVAPVDDHTLPTSARNVATLEQLVIKDLTDTALAQVKALITADLQAQGKLTDGQVVLVGPSGPAPLLKEEPPTSTG